MASEPDRHLGGRLDDGLVVARIRKAIKDRKANEMIKPTGKEQKALFREMLLFFKEIRADLAEKRKAEAKLKVNLAKSAAVFDKKMKKAKQRQKALRAKAKAAGVPRKKCRGGMSNFVTLSGVG